MKIVKKILKSIHSNAATYNGVMLYGLFFLFSLLAWTFAKSYTGDVVVNLVIVGKPNEATVIDSIPAQVTVPMEGKVFSHLYYRLFTPDATINFQSKYQKSTSELVITIDDVYAAMNLNSLYRPGNLSKMQSGFPLVLTVVTHKGKKVPVTFGSSISLRYNPVTLSLVNWPVCSPDSVVVFAKQEVLDKIDSVSLKPFVVKDLSDTVMTVGVQPIPGVRCQTTSVRLRLDLERNYLKRASISVEPKEVKGIKIQYQPATVDILYYVPESFYNDKAPKVAVFADDIDLTKKTGKVAIRKAEEYPHRKIYKILKDSVTWMAK